MKIVVCAKKDLAGCLALNRLTAALAGRHEVFVVLSDYVMKEETGNPYAAWLVAHERNIVLDRILPWLDACFPKGSTASCQTYAGLSARYGIPIELWGPIRSPEATEAMRKLAPDVIVSCRYDYVFRKEAIAIPRLGLYGMHPGALPAFQGLCCPYRAMERGEARSGCTVFQLDTGLDTGPVVDVGWWPIAYARSVLWNFVHTYFAGVDALIRHLPELETGVPLPATPQKPEGRRYYSYPTEQEFRSFTERGGRLVDTGDYLEMLSWFLPDGMADARMPELRALVSAGESEVARVHERA